MSTSPATPKALSSPNEAVLGSQSTAVLTIMDDRATPAPSGLQVRLIAPTQARLTWSDNCGNETQFRIERKAGDDGQWEFRFQTDSGTTTAIDAEMTSGTRYTYRVTAGTSYLYRVRAFNGSLYSPHSNEDAVTVQEAPAGPTGLDAVAISPTRMRLTWTDTSSDELYFYVYRRQGNGAYEFRFRVGRNVQLTEEGGLLPNTTYTYRVRTWNGNFYSPYSNEDTESTPILPTTTARAAAEKGRRRK